MTSSRMIVADSDDEIEEEFSPIKATGEPLPPPEVEPLSDSPSPSASDIHNRTSGSTDPAFFRKIYDEHCEALQQESSEKIIRETPKASISSGISLLAKVKAKDRAETNVSSVTDVTSPRVQLTEKSKSKLTQISDATELTTPGKTAKDQWDVPSSDDELAQPRSGKSSKGKNSKTYGKRKRKSASLVRNTDETPSSPTTKKQKNTESSEVFLDPLESNFLEPLQSSFYVAPSHLTASQKQQYQKVPVSLDMPPPPAAAVQPTQHPAVYKSSGATTIAYLTPSRYASSGPRLSAPWETGTPAVVDITSSPDAMTTNRDPLQRTKSIYGTAGASPQPNDQPRSTAKCSAKRKRSIIQEVGDDDLGRNESWDSDTIGYHRESYKPRPSRRRSAAVDAQEFERKAEDGPKDGSEDSNVIGYPRDASKPRPSSRRLNNLTAHKDAKEAEGHDISLEVNVEDVGSNLTEISRNDEASETTQELDIDTSFIKQTQAQPKKRGRKKKQLNKNADDGTAGLSTGAVDTALSAPAQEMDMTLEAPKKRGRKKKQPEPTVEVLSVAEEPVDLVRTTTPAPEEEMAPVEKTPSVPTQKTQASVEKSKKKRGCPKKTETVQSNQADRVHDNATLETVTKAKDSGMVVDTEPAGVNKEDCGESENVDLKPTAEGTSVDESATPLKEIERNSLLRSQLTVSDPAEKASKTATAKPAPRQAGKVPHRVGLSKRSRIAPLLKSLKK